MKHLKPDATAVYVAASGAAAAIEEAIEAEVPLIVAVAEFIPFHDMLRVRKHLFLCGDCCLTNEVGPGNTQDAVQVPTRRTELSRHDESARKV